MKNIPNNAKRVFKGVLFDVYQWEQEMFDGSFQTFEKVVRQGSTQLIIVNEDKKLILLNEEQPSRGKFIGMPGGMVEDGEDFESAAKRELLEELGLICNEINLWKEETLGSKVVWPTNYYIVKGVEKVQEPQLEPGEKIIQMELNFEEFLKKTQENEFSNKQFSNMIFKMIHTPGELDKFKRELFY